MTLEDRVFLAQKDRALREDIIFEYENYIFSCAKKSVGRYVSDSDDVSSIAMIAFDEAISKYDSSKGSFLNFAKIVIKNRIADYQRKELVYSNTIPFSQLTQTDKDGNETELQIEAPKTNDYDAKFELEALKNELNKYDISLFDLPAVTPKSKKTKSACSAAIRYILQNSILKNEVLIKGLIPIKLITDSLSINRKVIERHRKYIITAVVILTGDYKIIAEYIKVGENQWGAL